MIAVPVYYYRYYNSKSNLYIPCPILVDSGHNIEMDLTICQPQTTLSVFHYQVYNHSVLSIPLPYNLSLFSYKSHASSITIAIQLRIIHRLPVAHYTLPLVPFPHA